MQEIDFMSSFHKSTKRDYLARVNDPIYPKAKAAELAKKFDFDYWDGDRRICYGGYKYIPGRWTPVAKKLIDFCEFIFCLIRFAKSKLLIWLRSESHEIT